MNWTLIRTLSAFGLVMGIATVFVFPSTIEPWFWLMPLPDSPRLMMAMTGPVIGVASGLVLGVFAMIATRLVARPAHATDVRGR